MNQLTYPAPAFGRSPSVRTDLHPERTAPSSAADVLQTRFGLRVAARLSEKSQDLGPDITERLRFAREKALAQAREVRSAEPSGAKRRLGAGLRGFSIWGLRVAGVLPVLALVGGLVLIQQWQDQTQVATAAEVDANLLSDDLPPDAYSDPGFAEFLKTSAQPQQQTE